MFIMHAPLIGITVDNDDTSGSPRYRCGVRYGEAVARAGGVPVMLPQVVGLAGQYAAACDGLVFTGGGDARMEIFGESTHPEAKVIDAGRQAFELALFAAADARPDMPVLGVCLGMQLMGLRAGARFNQRLSETLATAEDHCGGKRHAVVLEVEETVLRGDARGRLAAGFRDAARRAEEASHVVVSWHRQALVDGGRLRVVARSADGVVEAIDDPARPFYLGVQWHPERGGDGPLNQGVFDALVRACRPRRAPQAMLVPSALATSG